MFIKKIEHFCMIFEYKIDNINSHYFIGEYYEK